MNRRHHSHDSRATFVGGRNGMVIGATFGALAFSVLTFALDLMNVAAGGPGLAVMAGVVTGGLVGTIWGALAARPGGRRNYRGYERRLNSASFAGADRRTAWMA